MKKRRTRKWLLLVLKWRLSVCISDADNFVERKEEDTRIIRYEMQNIMMNIDFRCMQYVRSPGSNANVFVRNSSENSFVFGICHTYSCSAIAYFRLFLFIFMFADLKYRRLHIKYEIPAACLWQVTIMMTSSWVNIESYTYTAIRYTIIYYIHYSACIAPFAYRSRKQVRLFCS